MADVNVGANAILRMEATATGFDEAANVVSFHWRLLLVERSPQGYGWSAGGISASVELFWENNGYLKVWEGTFGYDFRPSGSQVRVIAEGDNFSMGNLPNGDPRTFTYRGSMGNTGTSTAGGPASVDQQVAGRSTMIVPPAPSGVAAERISDSQTRVTWVNGGPSNGQATRNEYQAATPGAAGDGQIIIDAAGSVTTAILVNEKKQYRVRAGNGAGWSAWSAWSNTVYTTPAAPTNVQAAKNTGNDITITFTPRAYEEAAHQVWHGTVAANGTITWDAAPLATVGTAFYTDVNPDTSKVHVYRVRATQTGLNSDFAQSNSVQLLAAPNKPTVPAQPIGWDRSEPFVYTWTHNPVDTTPQRAYEVAYSTNGGTDWTSTGQVLSSLSSYTIPANAYPANTQLTLRVRTWGSAATGGADDTGASPWSSLRSFTFKTQPVVSITAPASGATLNSAVLTASLGFVQAEGGIFTKAEFELRNQANEVIESRDSTTRFNVRFDTQLRNQNSYTLRARAKDDNGIYSEWYSSTFNVQYLPPVPATVAPTYLEESGFAQLAVSIPAPTNGQEPAVALTITRRIGNDTETVVYRTAAQDGITFFDTTPTINGTNYYTITTESAMGAKSSSQAVLVTNELRRAFLSKGDGYTVVGVFGGDLNITDKLDVASQAVSAAGRSRPVGMYGTEAEVAMKITSFIFEGFGSTLEELRAVLLVPGKACYRDSSGRRVFGVATGQLSYKSIRRGTLSLSFEETS